MDQGERIGRQRLADNEIIGAIQPVSVPGIQGVTVRDRPGKGKLTVKGFRGGAGKGDQPVCFVGNKEGERVVEIIGVDGFVQIAFRKIQPQNGEGGGVVIFIRHNPRDGHIRGILTFFPGQLLGGKDKKGGAVLSVGAVYPLEPVLFFDGGIGEIAAGVIEIGKGILEIYPDIAVRD